MLPPLEASYLVSRAIFALIPIVAGVDKFFNLMTDWEKYVSPLVLKVVPLSAHQIMLLAGPGEILVGLFVALNPKLGCIALSAMLIGITLNLLTMPGQLHIAFLDLSLAILSLAFALLSAYKRKGE